MSEIGATFKPGEVIPHSGAYEVIHDPSHTSNHQVICLYGRRFPPCAHCRYGVRFRLVFKALHVTDHEHFVSDHLKTLFFELLPAPFPCP